MSSPYERKTSFDMGALPCADAGRLLPQGGGCQDLKTLPLPECVLQVTRPCPTAVLRSCAHTACRRSRSPNFRRSEGYWARTGAPGPQEGRVRWPIAVPDSKVRQRFRSGPEGPPENERGEPSRGLPGGCGSASAFFPRTPPPVGRVRRGGRKAAQTRSAARFRLGPPSRLQRGSGGPGAARRALERPFRKAPSAFRYRRRPPRRPSRSPSRRAPSRAIRRRTSVPPSTERPIRRSPPVDSATRWTMSRSSPVDPTAPVPRRPCPPGRCAASRHGADVCSAGAVGRRGGARPGHAGTRLVDAGAAEHPVDPGGLR